jgi:hypothetical protein
MLPFSPLKRVQLQTVGKFHLMNYVGLEWVNIEILKTLA